MQKVYTVDEARLKLERYCAYQDRCHREVIDKLIRIGMFREAIDTIVARLIQDGYLNEERFARNFARGKHRTKGWGIPRITSELKQRGISAANLKAALSEIQPEAYAGNFAELAQKKWDATRESDLLRKKKKVFDFLIRKGYESNLVYEVIARLARD